LKGAPNLRASGPIDEHGNQIRRTVQVEDVPRIRQHVKEVIEGTEFSGSRRCGQFLNYTVERTIAGDFESLKERVIGVELFGRSPSFNTVEDAVVRVTAREVRRRLLQHYSKYGAPSGFRLDLPLGSYVPEFTCEGHLETRSNDARQPYHDSVPRDGIRELNPVPQIPEDHVPSSPVAEKTEAIEKTWRRWSLFIILPAVFILAAVGIIWDRVAYSRAAATSTLPWSILFRPPQVTELILSDPDVASIQQITGMQISVSDYANHNYIPSTVHLTPEEERICRLNLKGLQTAAVDTSISMKIAELAKAGSDRIRELRSRSLQLSDLRSDDNFIFLGSPRSNPWMDIFADQLDFRLAFDQKLGRETIQNIHPHVHEQQWYTQNAQSQTLGESYAIVALVQNPGHTGQVLLLAGENGPGTQAAGELVTDLPRLTAALQQCGIDPQGPLRHFEMLLRLSTVADSLNGAQVVACHMLAGSTVLVP
jgi:hypothetical protein